MVNYCLLIFLISCKTDFIKNQSNELKENKKHFFNSKFLSFIIITLVVIALSGLSGWLIERLYLFFQINNPFLSTLFFAFILSSSLASKSLNKSILQILNLISKENNKDNLINSRKKKKIVSKEDKNKEEDREKILN